MKYILLSLLVLGCSSSANQQVDAAGGGGGGGGGGGSDASMSGFTITSTAFAADGTIPAENTCSPNPNTSPPLAWSMAPGDAKSFALVMTDRTLNPPLIHWVIFDIPATASALPAAVEKVFAPGNVTGAHQTLSGAGGGQVRGYSGPCPPVNGGPHDYEFAISALDVAALPGGSAQLTRQQAIATVAMHQLATAKLVGKFAR